MTLEETKKLVYVMTKNYPRYYANYSKDELMILSQTWYACLNDRSYQDCNNAFVSYLKSSANASFPPQPKDLIELIFKQANEYSELDSVDKAWELCIGLIRKYPSDLLPSKFKELPSAIQKCVGSASTLDEWGMIDSSTLNSVVKSNFAKTYQREIEKAKFNAINGNGSISIDEQLRLDSNNQVKQIDAPQLKLIDGVMKRIGD